ncbi:hypothetical protein ACWFQ4_26425, partial [Streptomyces koyangensis]
AREATFQPGRRLRPSVTGTVKRTHTTTPARPALEAKKKPGRRLRPSVTGTVKRTHTTPARPAPEAKNSPAGA